MLKWHGSYAGNAWGFPRDKEGTGARVGEGGGLVKRGRLGNWAVTLGLNRTAMLTYERNILISPQKREKNTLKRGLTEKIILRQRGDQAFRPTARKLCLALGMFA